MDRVQASPELLRWARRPHLRPIDYVDLCQEVGINGHTWVWAGADGRR